MDTQQVDCWFPTSIYVAENVLNESQKKNITTRIYEISDYIESGGNDWQGGTFTSHDKNNLIFDPAFEGFINTVTNQVNIFAEQHNSSAKFKCHTAWFNIGTAGNFQEYHYHADSVFSMVYYLSAPSGSGKIVFENPIQDMCPIPDINDRNDLSFHQVGYTPVENSLLIFRSYLRHMVTAGNFDGHRISIALNFSGIK